MDRRTFRRLADTRLIEAQALLRSRQWSGAYYLAGYSVECGLKAVLVMQFQRWQLPDKNQVQRAYTHRLDLLVGEAGLDVALRQARTAAGFDVNWTIAKDWTETSRYATWSRAQATELVDAVRDPREGVLPWLKRHW